MLKHCVEKHRKENVMCFVRHEKLLFDCLKAAEKVIVVLGFSCRREEVLVTHEVENFCHRKTRIKVQTILLTNTRA